MKIAIPLTESDEFALHYGASSRFEVFEVDPQKRSVRRRVIVAPPGTEPCAWAPLLQAAGVELVLAGGMGSGARHRMAEHGVEVVTGIPTAAPHELVAAWLAGRLVRGDNACDDSGVGPHHHAGHHREGGSGRCSH